MGQVEPRRALVVEVGERARASCLADSSSFSAKHSSWEAWAPFRLGMPGLVMGTDQLDASGKGRCCREVVHLRVCFVADRVISIPGT